MTFLFIFYLIGLAFLCHISCRCIEYQIQIRSFLWKYQVFVTDTQITSVSKSEYSIKKKELFQPRLATASPHSLYGLREQPLHNITWSNMQNWHMPMKGIKLQNQWDETGFSSNVHRPEECIDSMLKSIQSEANQAFSSLSHDLT